MDSAQSYLVTLKKVEKRKQKEGKVEEKEEEGRKGEISCRRRENYIHRGRKVGKQRCLQKEKEYEKQEEEQREEDRRVEEQEDKRKNKLMHIQKKGGWKGKRERGEGGR